MIIPLSRFKREMNSILKKLDKGGVYVHTHSVIYMTRNKKETFVLTSVGYYEKLCLLIDDVVQF